MAANSRRAERYRQQKLRARRRLIMGISAVALVGVIVAIVLLVGGGSSSPKAFAGSIVKLELSEYAIKGNLEVPAGPVRIEATNIGGTTHNVGVRGIKISRNLERGQSATLDLGVLAPGTYDLYCDVINPVDHISHVTKGMVAKLVVTAATTTSTAKP